MASDSSATSSPLPSDNSKGSSVSSGLREEYEDLLRYAVVTPNFDGKVKGILKKATPTVAKEGRGVHSVEVSHLELLSEKEEDELEEDSEDKEDTSSKKHEDLPIKKSESVLSATATTVNSKQKQQHSRGRSRENLELSRLEEKLDSWCSELKHNVLAEFEQSRLRAQEEERIKLTSDMQRLMSEQSQLESHLQRAKDLLTTYEQSIARKDHIIQNLTNSLQKQKERVQLARSFSEWRGRHNDERREALTAAIVNKMYLYNLKRKIFRGWFGLIQGRWKERVQKACQSRAEEICQRLNKEHQQHLAEIQQSLEESQQEILQLRQQRDVFEENMKKAFMRGVCALNMEAMSMFHSQAPPTADHHDNRALHNNVAKPDPPKVGHHKSKGPSIKIERHQ